MRTFFLVVLLLVTSLVSAESTPSDLNAWKSWIVQQHPEWNCSRDSTNALQCVFSGRASFDIRNHGADFTLQAELLDQGLLPIPGNAELPPTSVNVSSSDGRAVSAKMTLQNGEVFLNLPAGSYIITGQIHWGTVPQEIPLNQQTGLVEIRGQNQSQILRSNSGFRLTEKTSEAETDSLQIKVFRKFEDGSPLESETAINLRVSGAARSLSFGRVIPDNSTPISIRSNINFQLTKTGELTVELTPGEHDIRIRAVMGQPISELKVPKPSIEDWPEEEYWVWKSKEELRTVEILNGKPVSASVINLPADFASVTAYAVENSELKLKELTRGEERQAPDSLKVNREFWLDLDGSNFSAKDNIRGTASSSMRLDASDEVQLGRVTQSGNPAIVTLKNGSKGIELRDTNVDLEAISRVPNKGSISSTGWNIESLESVNIQLHLPPSWELLNLSGAHSYGGTFGGGSWTESWSLLEIFILSLVVIASYKLFGLQLAALFSLSIILNHSQHLEPRMLYLHLFALFGLKKFFKHLSPGWSNVVTILLVVTFSALALEQLTFAKLQFTQALFPQLPAGTRYRTILQELILLNEQTLLFWPTLLIGIAAAYFLLRWTFKDFDVWKMVGRIMVSGVIAILGTSLLGGMFAFLFFTTSTSRSLHGNGASSFAERDLAVQENYPMSSADGADGRTLSSPIAKSWDRPKQLNKSKTVSLGNNTVVAGPTLPSWNWKSLTVVVPGPVTKDARIQLRLAPPSVTRILCAIRAALALILSVLLFQGLGFSINLRGLRILPLGLIILASPSDVRADFPSAELLKELESQLVRDHCLTPPCSQIKELSISLENATLKLLLKVSSKGRSSILLPGPLENFTPSSVMLGQRPTSRLRRSNGGFLEAVVEDGDNLLEMTGAVPETFSIQFSAKPLFTKAELKDFAVEGLSKEGTVESGLRFVKKDQTGKSKLTESVVLPNWVVVTRDIEIAQTINVTTVVERIGNNTSSFSVSIPLLPEERIISGVGVATDRNLNVTFAPQVSSITYESIVPFSENLKFTAQVEGGESTAQLSERWVVSCASYFTCKPSGILPTSTVAGTAKSLIWQPFPGESASINIEQLGTLPGEFIAIDSLSNTVSYSELSGQGQLTIAARATQQSSVQLEAPAGIEVKKVQIDGRAANFSKLDFLLPPGSHQIELTYSILTAQGINTKVPQFKVTPPPHNVTTRVRPNPDRWLVWSTGDGWGPSVLYWSKLIFVIALCYALTHFGLLGISLFSSVMLGIGLTSLPLALCMFPLGWLIWLQLPDTLTNKVEMNRKWLKISITSGLAVISFVLLYEVVRIGLVLSPPMLVVGNSSTVTNLNWFVDHSGEILPIAQFISFPMWVWRAFSLVWALWLVSSIIRWIKLSTAKVVG